MPPPISYSPPDAFKIAARGFCEGLTPEDVYRIKLDLEESKRKNYKLEKDNTRLRKQNAKLEDELCTNLNPDQIEAIKTGRVKKWSKETMQKAIQHRFSCGVKGYSEI